MSTSGEYFAEELADLQGWKAGLWKIDGDWISAAGGRSLVRGIAMVFDRYLRRRPRAPALLAGDLNGRTDGAPQA